MTTTSKVVSTREQAWMDYMGDYYTEEGPERADEERSDRISFYSGWDAAKADADA